MRRVVLATRLGLVAALALAPADAAPEDTAAPSAEQPPPATVEGTVRYAGNAPIRMKRFGNDVDPETCGERVSPGGVRAGRRGRLADVSVELRLSGPHRADRPQRAPERVSIALEECRFEPRVVLAAPGSTLELSNPDGILHEVTSQSVRNPPLVARLPRYRRLLVVDARHFRRPERIKLSCERHDWTAGHVLVTDNPLHVITDRDGRFRFPEVPAGTHELVVWHEAFGTAIREVLVAPGETATVDVELE